MKTTFAIKMQHSDVSTLGALRCCPHVDVLETETELWLRYAMDSQEDDAAFRVLPGIRFGVHEDRQLTRMGTLVPQGHLPDGEWQPLPQWLEVSTAAPAFAGRPSRSVPLKLVRGGAPAEPSILVTDAATWQDYAVVAPQWRLERLAFAMSAEHHVVIRGQPLPPLSGERYVERSGVAIPVGWSWSPAIDACLVARVLGIEADVLALVHQDAAHDLIRNEDFVATTRSSVRASFTR